jgi:flagellar hook-associated protein 3 FlgL
MSGFFTRIASSDTYSNAVTNIDARASKLSSLQQNLTSGLRVVKPSDDPTAAAAAERANTRIAQVAVQQRALGVQKDAMSLSESTLSNVVSALQSFRELAVQAGNGTNTASDRASIATQMVTLRNQIFSYANTKDANGRPLFGGLASASTAFTDANYPNDVTYNGLGGQQSSSATALPPTVDGQAAFMSVPQGNGSFVVTPNTTPANTGSAWTDGGQVTDPTTVTGDKYSISFAGSGAATTYTVTNVTTGSTVGAANQPYAAGKPIAFDGISLTVSGAPANGDSMNIQFNDPINKDPAVNGAPKSLFYVLDKAISNIQNPGTAGPVPGSVATALSEIDAGLSKVQVAQGLAGNLLNQANTIDDNQSAYSNQLRQDKSTAQDVNMTQAISDFQNQTTGYQAALKSYAQIQSMNLFTYLNIQ